MDKRTFIRRAYKAINTVRKGRYYDDNWQGVRDVLSSITDAIPSVTTFLDGAAYEGRLGELGHRKVYNYTVVGCDKPVKMQVIASFCGTIADPMSAYDITVLLN